MKRHPYELTGNDGKTHIIRAGSHREAFANWRKWGYRHGGLATVSFLLVNDESEESLERATRFPIREVRP